jgi:hypothetical protein
MAILLKVPQEVSGAQVVSMRFIALLSWLRIYWSLLTVQNRAQVHRKPTGDLVPF